ncbi:hypothetical protein I4U23_027227 [Adineta vaga]|nr:hypothetical protein I4U23_027227 [Adineta vaga]
MNIFPFSIYLYILLVIIVQLSTLEIYLYNSLEENNSINYFQHNCFYYQIDDNIIDYGESMKLIYQIIPYCIRSDEKIIINENIINNIDISQIKTFDQLRQMNITSDELIRWSASIDIAERYEIYLKNQLFYMKILPEEQFYNCTWPRFGHMCQYEFDINEEISFNEFIFHIFQSKFKLKFSELNKFTNLSCYTHLKCMRGQDPLCLDWREICDGKIDCLNDGIDEDDCWQLEIKECLIHQYRCHNGAQCIPEKFIHDDPLNPDCLDQSDEPLSQLYPEHCPADPAFRCEETICRYSRNTFLYSCGDGQCIGMKDQCTNERSISYLPIYLLLNNCSRAMACLTLTQQHFDDILCDIFCTDSRCSDIIREECLPLFQFPPMNVLFDHVSFLYTNNQPNYNYLVPPPPEFVCYKEPLCKYVLSTIKTILVNNSTCIKFSEFNFTQKPFIQRSWDTFLTLIKGYFQGCSTSKHLTNTTNCLYSSLYRCTNSLTCISKHRLLDGNQDCYLMDDETMNTSCNLIDQYRFHCSLENRCISRILVNDFHKDCLESEDEISFDMKISATHISFQTICDGFQELSMTIIDGKNESDETNCHMWPCNNIYTNCNGIWNCLDGADEVNCSESRCPSSYHTCVSLITNNFTCLPIAQANDGNVDCLGGSDERHICRMYYPEDPSNRFLCRNSIELNPRCLFPDNLCNQVPTCFDEDDEVFCLKRDHFYGNIFCHPLLQIQRTDVETFLCGLSDLSKKSIVYFALYSNQLNNNDYSNKKIKENNLLESNIKNHDDKTLDLARIWRCNRGLPIRNKNNFLMCLCPPSYYGDRCQYQNQRISLILQLQAIADFRTVFTIVIMLIDNNDQINSYEHINYLPIRHCNTKFHIYLLYSTRPKDLTKNYSIRIDAFTAKSLMYRSSWLYPVEFAFLPVYRLSVELKIPLSDDDMKSCILKCHHGHCRRYENTEIEFCQCNSGWSGSQCLVSLDNYVCSSDSLHIGPSICICPLGKYGKHCLLEKSICFKQHCEHDGQCAPIDERMINNQWECICKEGYSGKQCHTIDREVIISFHDMTIPLSILVHFIYAPGNVSHERITTFKKISLDKNTATVYSSRPFHLIIVEFSDKYYLTTLIQQSEFQLNKSVHVNVIASQKCRPIEELFDNTIIQLELLQRIKYYHLPCQKQLNLVCFYDSIHMCLCNADQHANCFIYEHKMIYNCQGTIYCLNDARCYQDNTICPTDYLCECTECYYGTRCQLTTKDAVLSLDAILGNHIRPHLNFIQQPIAIKISSIITIIMLILGIIDGFVSCMTFKVKKLRKVGCGYYLFVLSIISPLLMIILSLKVCFLILTQMSVITNRFFLFIQCRSIDFFLLTILRLNGWLNACVSLERAITIFKSTQFSKEKSKYAAKWVIIFLPILIISTTIYDPIHRHLIDDVEEQRIWCVINYTGVLRILNIIMNLCHFIIPFCINIISAFVIILKVARKRSKAHIQLSYRQHISEQFHQHKHLLISSMILVLLALPHLIISFLSGCMKSIREPWLFLFGFYISFVPSTLVFVIYVLPSQTYKKEFIESINNFISNLRHFI